VKPPAEETRDILRIHPIACVAVIVLAIGILLHQSIVGGKGLVPADGAFQYLPWSRTTTAKPSNVLLYDQYLQFVPSREFFHDELQKGRFPLWNPHMSSGVPSVASMQGAALYPINLLFSPLSPFVSSGLAAFAKLCLAGIFTLLYLRRVGVTNAAALVGALTFSLSGFLIVWLGHPHTNSAVLLPALFYFVEGLVAGPRALGQWSGLALTMGAVLLGGHLPTTVHMTIATAAYAAFRMFTARGPNRFAFIVSLSTAAIAGALVAAPQLLPFAEYYRLSSMSQSSEALNRWASHLQPATLIHFVLPYVSGSPAAGFEHLAQALGFGTIENFNERTGYVGLLALFLASVAVVRRRSAVTFFFAGLAAIALTIIYGVPPWPAIMRRLPVLNSINHERLLLWLDWSAAVLAGFGADTLIRSGSSLRQRRVAIALVAVISVPVVAFFFAGRITRFDTASRSFLASQLWVLAGGLVVIVLVTRRWIGPKLLATLCIGWTAVDLLWFAFGYNPAVPRAAYKPTTDAIRFLQADGSTSRVFGMGTILAPNLAGMYGLDDLRGQDFMNVARYEEFITGRAGNFLFYMSADQIPSDFALTNVKYVLLPNRLADPRPGLELVYEKEIAIYLNTRHRPRALVVFDHRVETNSSAVLAAVRDPAFDPEQTVWLEEPPPDLPAESAASTPPSAAGARITKYEPDDVTVEAELPKPGFVLLLDTYFPGWTATVDGRTVPISRADYVYRAVRVPSGRHVVAFTYRPFSFRLGLGASLATLVLMATLGWRERRRIKIRT
jgi:hypothetical protein